MYTLFGNAARCRCCCRRRRRHCRRRRRRRRCRRRRGRHPRRRRLTTRRTERKPPNILGPPLGSSGSWLFPGPPGFSWLFLASSRLLLAPPRPLLALSRCNARSNRRPPPPNLADATPRRRTRLFRRVTGLNRGWPRS